MTASISRLTEAENSVPLSRLRLLGGFELVVRGVDRTSAFPYEKAKLLVALLALPSVRRGTRRELAGWLWPELPDTNALARLRHALHALRRIFEDAPELLVIENDRLSLDLDRLDVDALILLGQQTRHTYSAQEKLAAYRGSLLEGITLPDGDGMGAWRRAWQTRIEMELAQCRSQLIDLYIEQGQQPKALAHAKRWVSRWPEDEACHRHLIRLLLALDDREAALRAFDHCTHVLADRLGAHPSSETWALLERDNAATPAPRQSTRIRAGMYLPLAVLAINVEFNARAPTPDTEHAIDMLHDALQHIEEHTITHGGWLAPRHANTVLAYFGYPALSERPASQAVTLAHHLACTDLPQGITIGMGLHADIALTAHTGLPDIGHFLAHRAIQLAWFSQDRETLLSDEAIVRLSDCRTLPCKRRGESHQALGPGASGEPTRRMFGRSQPFEQLTAHWNALKGRATITSVLLHGQAGIGKTTLAQAVVEYARQSGGEAIVLTCQARHAMMAWHPIKVWLRNLLELADTATPGATPKHHTDVLDRLRTQAGLKKEAAEQLWQWLLEPDGTGRRDPTQDDELMTVLAHLLLQRTPAKRPLLVLWENLHWADDACVMLVEHMLGKVVAAPTMMIGTTRETFLPQWDSVAIELPPLDKDAISQLFTSLARTHKMSQSQRVHAQEMCGGNPLHAHELAQQAARPTRHPGLACVTDRVALQLNLLGEKDRYLIQMLSLLNPGATIDTAYIAAVLGNDIVELDRHLETLRRHDLVLRDTQTGWRSPNVISSAVRRSMLREHRHALHHRIAAHLQSTNGPSGDIARHLQEAGDPMAAQWWRKAAWELMNTGRFNSVLSCLDNALALSHQINTEAERTQFEFDCLMIKGELAGSLEGPGAPITLQAYARAAEICPPGADAQFNALWALWNTCQNSGDYDDAVNLAHRLLKMANEQTKSSRRNWSLYAVAVCALWKGDVIESERLLRQALQGLSFPLTDIGPAPVLGFNAGALIHALLALVLSIQGRNDAAQESLQTALYHAQQDTNNNALMQALCYLMLVKISYLSENWMQMGAVAASLKQSMETQALCPQFMYALSTSYAGLGRALQGDATALPEIEAAVLTIGRSMPAAEVSGQCILAHALSATGNHHAALEALARAEVLAEKFMTIGMHAEILCLRGDALAQLDQPEQARHAWQQATIQANGLGTLQYAQWAQRRINDLSGPTSRTARPEPGCVGLATEP